MSVSLGELAVRFGCELRGDPDTRIERVATLATADAGSLAFLANPRYRTQLGETRAVRRTSAPTLARSSRWQCGPMKARAPMVVCAPSVL